MEEEGFNLKTELAKFTKIIDRVIENEKDQSDEFDLLENWLRIHIEKIRFSKLKKSDLVRVWNDNKSQQKDAIIVFDGQLNIHYYSGYITNLLDDTLLLSDKISFDTITDNLDVQKFLLFIECENEEHESQFELHLKSAARPTVKCFLQIDKRLSNFKQKLFVANLTIKESVMRNLSDYQSMMLDNLPGMDIYLFDKDYRFIVSGGKEKERYNKDNIDYLGKTLFDIADKKTQRNLYPFFNRALHGEATEGEIRYKNDIYYISASPVKDHDGTTLAGIILLQNITFDKILSQQLKDAKEEAQKANKAKSIFIANISHEIRTPLNTIIGFAEQLYKTRLTETQSKYVSLINSASDHLLSLVTEVVFLFKLGLGKVFIDKSPFSLKRLLEELKELFENQAKEKNLTFKVIYDNNIPDALIGDSFRLKQILINLLTNAIKYTDTGEVILTCKVKKQTKQKAECMFVVKDTGIGISKEDLPHIYNVFEQGNIKAGNERGGAGLGLGICHKLVELLDGSISAKSKLNAGSTFTVCIPFVKTINKKLKKQEIKFNLNDKNLMGKRILIAEDDVSTQMLAELIMSNFKTNYVLVKDGIEALKELKVNKFDIILLDVQMPKMSGTEVIREIRSNNTNLNFKTPALSITANALKSDIHGYLRSGFDDYLVKPFKEQELYNKLCNLLSVEPKVLIDREMKDEEYMGKKDIFNINELVKTSDGDKAFFNSMIDNFIANAEDLLADFETMVNNKSWDNIGERAHKAIPSFKYFGLNNISYGLKQIEKYSLREKKYESVLNWVEQVTSRIKQAIDTAKKEKQN